MQPVKVEILKGSPIPTYGSANAAGFDLAAKFTIDELVEVNKQFKIFEGDCFEIDHEDSKEYILLFPNCRLAIPTGIKVAIPEDYQIEVRPRSGKTIKEGLTIINTPGTIDADYRGEILLLVVNLSNEFITIKSGDKVAQGVLMPVIKAEFVEVDELSETVRGEGGFGHTDLCDDILREESLLED